MNNRVPGGDNDLQKTKLLPIKERQKGGGDTVYPDISEIWLEESVKWEISTETRDKRRDEAQGGKRNKKKNTSEKKEGGVFGCRSSNRTTETKGSPSKTRIIRSEREGKRSILELQGAIQRNSSFEIAKSWLKTQGKRRAGQPKNGLGRVRKKFGGKEKNDKRRGNYFKKKGGTSLEKVRGSGGPFGKRGPSVPCCGC